MEKLKVLLVDDDVIHKINFSEAIKSTGIGNVIHSSTNGALALEWLMHNEVNVVMLDAIIQGESSIEILKSIKNQYDHIEVIMINDNSPRAVEVTLEGLKCGAFDFIQTISASKIGKLSDTTINQLMLLFTQIKIKQANYNNYQGDRTVQESRKSPLVEVEPQKEAKTETTSIKVNHFNPLEWNQADLILIAASTGGPAALELICESFPADFPKPVLIVQHMPSEFTKALAQSLGKKCLLPIAEGQAGDIVGKEKVLIAPGGVHSIVEGKGSDKVIRLEKSPHVNGVRPAADVLFKSCAKAYAGKNILVLILTGMGNDGMEGVKEIKKRCNCYCIVQSEKSCVIYGMPRCVHEAGLADEVLDLNDITTRLYEIAMRRSW